MTKPLERYQSLLDPLDEIPSSILPAESRKKLAKHLRQADKVAVVDDRTGKIYVDEQRWRGLLRAGFDEEVIDAHLADLRKSAPGLILGEEKRRDMSLRPVPLLEVMRQAGHPPAKPRMRTWKSGATVDDLKDAIRHQVPKFDEDDGDLIARTARPLITNQPFEDAIAARTCNFADCFINGIGFWLFMLFVSVCVIAGLSGVGPALAPAAVYALCFILAVFYPLAFWRITNALRSCERDPCWRGGP